MGKLIAKTAAYTLVAVIAAALILFGVVSLAAPSAMASFTDALGMDGACAAYSVAAAEKSGKTEDLAIAVERSYNSGRFEAAASCGEELLARDDFAQYCSSRNEEEADNPLLGDTAQYLTGIVAVSQYRTGAGGLDTAFGALGGSFPEKNAVVILADAAMALGDKEFCLQIVDRLSSVHPSEADKVYFVKFREGLETFCA